MLVAKRAVSAAAVLAVLVAAALYLPSPLSTAAWIVLGLFALILFLPLLLALVGMFSDSDDNFFEDLLEGWFLWSALEWPWNLMKWTVSRSNRGEPEPDDPNRGR